VAAVYRALLEHYEPREIGIYGTSAGGILTAEAIAWFEDHGLPLPGAIGTFCAGVDQDSAMTRGNSGNCAVERMMRR
jgi:epsilon-lactone hydrolase